jgi:hypothetical protein
MVVESPSCDVGMGSTMKFNFAWPWRLGGTILLCDDPFPEWSISRREGALLPLRVTESGAGASAYIHPNCCRRILGIECECNLEFIVVDIILKVAILFEAKPRYILNLVRLRARADDAVCHTVLAADTCTILIQRPRSN